MTQIVDFEHISPRVQDVIRSLFPRGTTMDQAFTRIDHASSKVSFGRRPLPSPAHSKNGTSKSKSVDLPPSWERAPVLPPDVFAVAAVLLDVSGACHHVLGREVENWPRAVWLTGDTKPDRPITEIVDEWRASPQWDAKVRQWHFAVPSEVDAWWAKLWSFRKEDVFKMIDDPKASAPSWWESALRLLTVADEASRTIGFQGLTQESNVHKFFEYYLLPVPQKGQPDTSIVNSIGAINAKYTISTVPPDVACVLPKSRTAQVGCTLRSLSHNLALLPPRGKARAYWHVPPRELPLVKDTKPLNMLLIPHPYQVPPDSFKSDEDITRLSAQTSRQTGWFELQQGWQPIDEETGEEDSGKIVNLTKILATRARESGCRVNAIVFPESSLTYKTYDLLLKEISDAKGDAQVFHDVEFVVAGLRTDDEGIRGNFAAACIISRKGSAVTTISNVQQKHHRWRIDERQILAYGLGSSLSTGVTWWEKLPLLSRSLNLFVFRTGSTLAPLICEDLARLEPIHDLVRSIGPNIVIALLLDGPQVTGRWPARYATGLVDDPGSSVLTFCSLGIVARADERARPDRRSRSVALWRDDKHDCKEISLEPGTSAVLLSLSGQRVHETTLDGRDDASGARLWVYSDHICISLPDREKDNYRWAIEKAKRDDKDN